MRQPILGPMIGLCLVLTSFSQTAAAETARAVTLTEWKSVFGRVEARDMIPARSRIGGVVVEITVEEGDGVAKDAVIATIRDEKLALQLDAVQAQIDALGSQLDNARAELKRGEDLLERGVTTAQRLDALRTQVEVLENQIDATRAEKSVVEQQAAEGAVLAPLAGKVLDVPLTSGTVIMPGEVVAQIGGGGFFLRLAVPERHAAHLAEGAEIMVGENGAETTGRLAKVYPNIENGRVIADVEIPNLNSDFVNARVLVRLPIGTREAVVVPESALTTRMGLDFVTVAGPDGTPVRRTVVPGARSMQDGVAVVEILSGLSGGETLVDPTDD
ncbi:efflux RND transporter periplasmic adaptor subunit [Shimia sp. FJ5]|uniref:efflux RND transporter periplasmic adaptor subunit n=1 Tax=Shimia sp. FJ5 TaxID=3079054 RepID=UPI002632188D|nr:efflux RND transporter periplasmic adaptor subunit [Shimia sp. FJ5]MDV4146576.1 efflux RND transporter periplasmic adaptor subunit [Shimia sp. FJ5]